MGLNHPSAGINYAIEFQVSGLPFVTSSTVPAAANGCQRIDFPNVSKFIEITNNATAGNYLRVGFSRNGVCTTGWHYLLDGGKSIQVDVRVKELYLAGNTTTNNVAVFAGLTNVPSRFMQQLTGTLADGSTGWTGVG